MADRTYTEEEAVELKRQATVGALNKLIPDPVDMLPPVKRGRGRPKKMVAISPEEILQDEQDEYECELFREGLLVLMRNRNAASERDIRACVGAALEYVKVVTERY